ncbi:MAG TPA: MFS transporter [Vicinamibacterales bacterium]|nr:MFS transporter [Vicinamibacterales bacterium]
MPTAAAPPAPPSSLRWLVLLFTSLAMFGNYYVYDSIAPLSNILQSELGFTSTQVGLLQAIYSAPNIVMVLIGGVLVDRFGARQATAGFTAVCLVGALLSAASGTFWIMALGRLIFGLGGESMIVAVTAVLGHWFRGRQLGFAFGVNLAIARAGSYAADLSPTWAGWAYDSGWRAPLLIAVGFAVISFGAAAVYWAMEESAARRYALPQSGAAGRFVWSDLVRFDRSYWFIVGLCVTFYSVIFPFRSTFAIEYFQNAQGLSLEQAGQMNGHVFLAAIFATPLFGLIVDRLGRRSIAMFFGSLLLLAVFPTLLYTDWDLWVSTVMIGIAFSLVPAVLWASVPYLVDSHRLGTALGLMTMLQNVGLTVVNVAAGRLNDWAGAGAANPAGYRPMLLLFTALSVAGLIFSLLLRRREAGPYGHGLETVRA